PDIREVRKLYSQKYFFIKGKFEPRPLKPLDKDLAKAIKKRKEKEHIYESLPKIDCGACGAPTCLTFAEDVVKAEAELIDCIFNLSQRFKEPSQGFSELFNKYSFRSQTKSSPKKHAKKEKQ
ncbi:hypothetical protein LCGC14_0803640, partial [marine sediment metagenome]|nr:hypothetical protein [Candidatus Aminicenantes bacterium]